MTYSPINNYSATSGIGFNSQMSDVLLGAMVAYFPFEAFTSSNLINDFSDVFVSKNLNSATNASTTSSLDQKLSLSNTIISEVLTDTQLDVLEVQDAPNDYGVLFIFDQLNVGNLATNATESLGSLYDDPIEYGNPLEDAQYWRQQQGQNSCAVVAQICVYRH
ncbi:hypothetical protein [Chroococcus sp. FPU101]|uniref:hypothetical protein n=1 Tax=Chroococcus sp. FPU101 TaxID=1974212 RepID=UPI001A8CD98B|nr:hypothetical protein [Chroococcus sp. FPU101]GFE71771.1 hypothetical protein CFPU101_43810 [Chroococcus sp. FPU101]